MTGVALALADILSWLPDAGLSSDDIQIGTETTAIPSPLPIADCASAAYGALAIAAARFHADRTGQHLTPVVNRRLASLAMSGHEYLTINGKTPAKWDPLTGYYQCKDGGYVYLHANFPHLRDGLLACFDAANSRDAVAASLARITADQAEDSAQTKGLCCIKLRQRTTWNQHPQRAALAHSLPVRCAPLVARSAAARGAATAARTGRSRTRPLEGIRVLDLSRVIAGPMAGRALAELGADVIRISAPDLPHIEALVIDTGFNKRAAFADLRTTTGRKHLSALIADADILIDGFRPGALAQHGYDARMMADLNPDLTYVTLSAFSDVGPWAGRRGYDSYVQAGIGFTAPKIEGDPPLRLACQPLDYLTGCLSAYGAIIGLIRAHQGHGGTLIETSLARTGMWLWDMADRIGTETCSPDEKPSLLAAEAEGFIRHVDSPEFGHIGSLAPPYGYCEIELTWDRATSPLGSDQPEWRPRPDRH